MHYSCYLLRSAAAHCNCYDKGTCSWTGPPMKSQWYIIFRNMEKILHHSQPQTWDKMLLKQVSLLSSILSLQIHPFFSSQIFLDLGDIYTCLVPELNAPSVCFNISGNPDVWWVLAKILVNFFLIWKISFVIWTNWAILPLFTFSLDLVLNTDELQRSWPTGKYIFLFLKQITASETMRQ